VANTNAINAKAMAYRPRLSARAPDARPETYRAAAKETPATPKMIETPRDTRTSESVTMRTKIEVPGQKMGQSRTPAACLVGRVRPLRRHARSRTFRP